MINKTPLETRAVKDARRSFAEALVELNPQSDAAHAKLTDEDGNRIGPPQRDGSRGRLRIYKGDFEDHVAFDKDRHDRDWKIKRGLTEATFGWAITGHKAQRHPRPLRRECLDGPDTGLG